MKAKVTVEFIISEVCSKKDLKDTKMSFNQMVKYLIQEEGLYSIADVDTEPKIIKIQQIKEKND